MDARLSRGLWLAGLACAVLLIRDLSRAAEQPETEGAAKPFALALKGRVVAFEEASLYSRIPGYVTKWTVDIGDRVKKGQLLAELSAPELEAEVQRKEALVDQARARVKVREAAMRSAEAAVQKADGQLLEARLGLKRAQLVFEHSKAQRESLEAAERTAPKSVRKEALAQARYQQELDEVSVDQAKAHVKTIAAAVQGARTRLLQARVAVQESAASVQVAGRELERAKALFSFAQIRAPFDGIVVSRAVNTGDLVLPPRGDRATPLFQIDRTDKVRVMVDVPDHVAPRVRAGVPVQVRLHKDAEKTIKAAVTRTSWALTYTSQTLRAEIDLPSTEGLRPGMSVLVSLQPK